MQRPKVLLLGKLPPPYMGPAIATQILLNSKLKERYELYHVNTNVHKSISTIGAWSLDKIFKNLRIYFNLFRALRKEKPDLVLIPISQSTIGFLKDSVFILLSRLLGQRTLIQLRGSNIKNWLGSASGLTRIYVGFVVRTAQGVIVLGHKLRYLFANYFPEDRIFVVPNGANYQIPECKRAGEHNRVRILYFANLMRSKGIEDVIEATHLLEMQCDADVIVDVVGSWLDVETKEKCQALMDEYKPPVTFHSVATGVEKFRFFAEADIFVFTPREPEGHPWVIVEALAASLPIVSTDQGAITESVLDGINGFIVDIKSPQQIAKKLQLLVEKPAIRSKLGAASRVHYLNNFTEDKMVERLSVAFDSVLAQ